MCGMIINAADSTKDQISEAFDKFLAGILCALCCLLCVFVVPSTPSLRTHIRVHTHQIIAMENNEYQPREWVIQTLLPEKMDENIHSVICDAKQLYFY